MSLWIDIKDEDIEIEKEGINFYVHSDYAGAVYGTMSIGQIKYIYNTYKQLFKKGNK